MTSGWQLRQLDDNLRESDDNRDKWMTILHQHVTIYIWGQWCSTACPSPLQVMMSTRSANNKGWFLSVWQNTFLDTMHTVSMCKHNHTCHTHTHAHTHTPSLSYIPRSAIRNRTSLFSVPTVFSWRRPVRSKCPVPLTVCYVTCLESYLWSVMPYFVSPHFTFCCLSVSLPLSPSHSRCLALCESDAYRPHPHPLRPQALPPLLPACGGTAALLNLRLHDWATRCAREGHPHWGVEEL